MNGYSLSQLDANSLIHSYCQGDSSGNQDSTQPLGWSIFMGIYCQYSNRCSILLGIGSEVHLNHKNILVDAENMEDLLLLYTEATQ